MPDQTYTDDQLIDAVRRAFSRYTAPRAVPPAVPNRTRAGRPGVFNASLVAIPAAALGLAFVLVAQALTQPSSAFATWTTVPDEPDPAAATSATAECGTGLPLVALDERGRVSVALFSDGESLADCMLVDGQVSASSHGAEPDNGPLAGAIEVLNHGRYERGSTVHIFSGGVSSDVASVLVTRDDGVEVTATVAGGVFLVWWPAEEEAARFTAFDSAGDVIQTIDNPLRLPELPPSPAGP